MTSATPSIHRVLRDVSPVVGQIISERYHRILPILSTLLSHTEIVQRNKTWPGTSPAGKGATRWLMVQHKDHLREVIKAFAKSQQEPESELSCLTNAYLRHGPIGLIDAIDSDQESLIDEDILACARFHRLAKHPRADVGLYIRELLARYVQASGSPTAITPFVARYAFASTRRLKQWYVSDDVSTEHVPKTTRRLNLDAPYLHQRWRTSCLQLELLCASSARQTQLARPWMITMQDEFAGALMGFRLLSRRPTAKDYACLLRRSIWHHDMAWWPERGAPEYLRLPTGDGGDPLTDQALGLLHITVEVGPATPPPPIVQEWHTAIVTDAVHDHQPPTVFTLEQRWLDYLQHQAASRVTRPTFTSLLQQQVSLPWSNSLAAVGLLPSAGQQEVGNGEFVIFGVPFDAQAAGIAEGARVEVRYDPDDARTVFLIIAERQVIRAEASAFEGPRIPWSEVSDQLT